MSSTVIVLISSCVTFTSSVIIIGWLIRLSHRYKWYDDVDHRKIHSGDIPRIGGLGIFSSFFLGLIVFFILSVATGTEPSSQTLLRYVPLFAGLCIILGAGLADDFASLRARWKLLLQIAAAGLITGFGFVYTEFSLPGFSFSLSLGVFGYVFTIFWLVGMSNAVNLIDGMDGLAGGISSVASLFIGIIAVLQGDTIIAVFALSLFAGTVGFMVYNFPPAKIFMGDSGSLFLGFVIAVLPLLKRGGPSSTYTLLSVFTLMLIPILDTFEAIIRRVRNGVPIYNPDQNHLHHKLLRLGHSNRKILVFVYLLTVIAGIAVLFWGYFGSPFLVFLPVGSCLVTCIFFLVLDRKNRTINGGEATRINDVHNMD